MSHQRPVILHCDGPGPAGSGCDEQFDDPKDWHYRVSHAREQAKLADWSYARDGEGDLCPACTTIAIDKAEAERREARP